MRRKSDWKNRDTLIDNISLGFTSVLGVAGVAAAGAFIPVSVLPAAAIQAGAYCPAIVAAVVKRSINSKEFSEKIEGQIKSCSETTAKEYIKELENTNPTMCSLFRDVWENDGIYDKDSTLDSIKQNMKSLLVRETKWEGYEITPKDIDGVVHGYVHRFFINLREHPELDKTIMLGTILKLDEVIEDLNVLKRRVDGLSIGNEKNIRAFYEHIYSEFTKPPKSELYGKISLKDGYIEPKIDVDEATQSVREFLETWVGSDSTITVISGEPGHGKTSLCWKAMCDFYKNGWLSDKVNNVFCFSLNPANTDALSNDSLNLYKLLSWGNNRTSTKHMLDDSDCENALIFFDGFDELLEWHSNLNLVRLIEDIIIPFQEDTCSHIVITSRDMVIDPDIDYYYLSGGVKVRINRLQPVTESQQINWIESYVEKCRDTSPEKAAGLEEYLEKYKEIPKDDGLKKLFGIPIIFRMIVEAKYLPEESGSIPQIYDELFHVTWIRHNKKTGADNELTTKKKLQDLALRAYLDNNDTAEREDDSISPWLFSFYTAHEGNKRVGFLHRSFYQYFLAHEVLSWYRDRAEGKNEGLFRDQLSYLARRRLDKTTLFFIRELYGIIDDKESFKVSFNKAYSILKETDGFLPLPQDEDQANKIKKEIQIVRANNVFWNIVSIGSICGHKVCSENINTEALRVYDMSWCVLWNVTLNGSDLRRVNLSMADIRGANFNESNLGGADLSGANLSMSKLVKANLNTAILVGTYFRETDLRLADIGLANFSEVDFSLADLRGASFFGTHLNSIILNGTKVDKDGAKYLNSIGGDISRAIIVDE